VKRYLQIGDAPIGIGMILKFAFGSRAFWLRQMRQWHWISAAVSLIGMLLFAITGITLNHAGSIEARPDVRSTSATLPADLLQQLNADRSERVVPIPDNLAAWIAQALSASAAGRNAEWSPQEIYIALPRPGGDAWIRIDRADGEAQYEVTRRGWISYLNDLHKGRNTGAAWSLFLDVFAVACIVFCVTGLVLLQLLAVGRPSTWPIVGLGLLIPVMIVVFFIH
jgi:hypothetical protein